MKTNAQVSFILILQGGPATGKSTLAIRIAEHLQLPYFSKDAVKEPMFNFVGSPTTPAIFNQIAGSRFYYDDAENPLSGMKMEEASVAILFNIIEAQIRAKRSCVIDCTFTEDHAPLFQELLSQHGFHPIQIYCHTSVEEMLRRWRKRAESGERHRGHLDQLLYESFCQDPSVFDLRPLEIGGSILSIETTQTNDDDFCDLLRSIQKEIEAYS